MFILVLILLMIMLLFHKNIDEINLINMTLFTFDYTYKKLEYQTLIFFPIFMNFDYIVMMI